MTTESADRRAFLKAAGGAAVTSSLFAGKLKGANDKVNIAFIGMGRMGSDNMGYCAHVPGFEIVAVCDVYQPALDAAVERARQSGFAGVKAVHDFREILADKSVDAVCIATPDHWHACMAVEACKAGKDVWVEKPACVYVAEGLKMIQAARKYERVVQGGTMQRSGGFFRKAREIVKSGDLGDITFCRTFQADATKKEGWGNPPDSDPPRDTRLGSMAGTGADAALQPQPLGRGQRPLLHVPLFLGLCRRQHDRLGCASARHRPVRFR